MKTIYRCSKCDKEFDTKEECISHEIGIHVLDENLKGIDVLIAVRNICIRHGRCANTCPFLDGKGCILSHKPNLWSIISDRYNLEKLKKQM